MRGGESFMKILERKKVIIGLAILFWSFAPFSEIYSEANGERFDRYSQNQGTEYWEEITHRNFPLDLIDWQLVSNARSREKYKDKHIIGTVENKSSIKFSEVKIEFAVYDVKGNQIAIVSSNLYDFEPRHTWKFEILVTGDVEKADLKGLYVPVKEL
jgi:hypothetical protein